MEDLKIAKQMLQDEKLTLAIVKDNKAVFKSDQRGIKPVMSALLEGDGKFCGASAADMVVGKAAAMLYASLGIASVYGALISEGAIKVLEQNNINFEYGKCTEYILNRDKTDKCPIEKIAFATDDAYELIKRITAFFENPKKPQ